MKSNSMMIRGFTLIEMMLVSAIIGLLATIVVPKFGDMINKAKEASVKAKLGSFRSALSIYYADTEGYIPTIIFDMAIPPGFCVLVPKYIDAVPTISIPTVPMHGPCSGIRNLVSLNTNDLSFDPATVGAAWNYYGFMGKSMIFINCTHADTTGHTWSAW